MPHRASFDIAKLTIVPEMILSQHRTTGVVQVAECNSSVTIIADIVCVPMKDLGGQVKPETWYLPSRHTWQYPIIRGHAQLLTRLKVEVQHHSVMQSDDSGYKYFKPYPVLWEGHRLFLVVHWLIGPYSQDMKVALNISASLGYYKGNYGHH